MIKAFIFDIGDVITSGDFSSAYADFAKSVGIETSVVENYYNSNIGDLLTGKISTQETLEAFGISDRVTVDEALDIWKRNILENSKVDERMLKLLEHLRTNYKVVALSNITESRIGADEEMGLYEYFDDVVLSLREGIKKPDPAFFQIALDKAECLPEEAIFIDDYEKQTSAAKEIGIDAIQFFDYSQLTSELSSRGIKL